MRALKSLLLAVYLASVVPLVVAQEQQLPSFAPDDSEPAGEPEVTIHQDGDREIAEYRLNGVLYAVKVTPKNGKPYFLVRSDGDNNFFHSDQPGTLIPSWKIFSW